jgi:uncharacterized DUF497 family protein
MPYYFFQWTEEIVAHLAEHGLTAEDFENVVSNPVDVRRSRSSDLPAAFGYTGDGRYIIAIYEHLDDMTILPVTAFEVEEPR